jgi:hypothetical protein
MRRYLAAVLVFWGCIVLAPIVAIALYRRSTILAYASAFAVLVIGVVGFRVIRFSGTRSKQRDQAR